MPKRFPLRIGAALAPLFTVLGAAPAKAFVDLDEAAGTLRVKFGIWFDESLPLGEIASVEPSSWPWYGGLGVKLGPTRHAVSVVGSFEGVVALRFTRPQRMRVLVNTRRPELRLALVEPEGFIESLRAAVGRTSTG